MVAQARLIQHDPLDSMLRFHRSIRAALDTLDEVAARALHGVSDIMKMAALYDFFVGPMRWHDDDERESLLRRLAALDPAQFGDALHEALLEHASIGDVIDGVIGHLDDVARRCAPPDARLLRTTASRLRALMEAHLEREEREIFPRARALLGPRELETMQSEIAARRLQRRGP